MDYGSNMFGEDMLNKLCCITAKTLKGLSMNGDSKRARVLSSTSGLKAMWSGTLINKGGNIRYLIID